MALLGSAVALSRWSCSHYERRTPSREALIGTAGASTATFTSTLAVLLVATGAGAAHGGFAAFVLAVVCGFIAFCLWVELVVRASAIAIAALFIPLALAGAVWPATAAWGRRLAEVLGTLILSKVAIAGVFALAINEIGTPNGLTGLIQGTALLLLATFAPWALLHLIPAVRDRRDLPARGARGRATRWPQWPSLISPIMWARDGAGFSPPSDPEFRWRSPARLTPRSFEHILPTSKRRFRRWVARRRADPATSDDGSSGADHG